MQLPLSKRELVLTQVSALQGSASLLRARNVKLLARDVKLLVRDDGRICIS